MTDANPTPPEEGDGTVDAHPDYLALTKAEQEEIDGLIAATQDMQNEVDKWCGVMGGPVFYLARQLLHLQLALRTVRRENRELLRRVRALEDSIS